MSAEAKICPGCGKEKPLTDYAKNDALVGGRHLTCKSCTADLAKAAPNAAISAYYSEGSPLFRAYRDPELRGRFVGKTVGEIAQALLDPPDFSIRLYDGGELRGVQALLANEAVRREIDGKSVDEVAELIVAGSPADQAAASRAYAERQHREAAPPTGDVARYAEAIEREREDRAYADRVAEHHSEELREYAEVEQLWGLFANSVGVSSLELRPPAPPAPKDLKTYEEEAERSRDEKWAREQLEKLKAAEAEKAWREWSRSVQE